MAIQWWQRAAVIVWVVGLFWASGVSASDDVALARLLRAEAFNKEFEGFDTYQVSIEEDHAFDNGSREVTAVAFGTFMQNHKRLKVLFLIAGDHIIGGQVLEGTDLPPCAASQGHLSSPL